jgi:hypothetical protein
MNTADLFDAAAKLLCDRAEAVAARDPSEDGSWHVVECADETAGDCPCIVAQGRQSYGDDMETPKWYVADAETPEIAQWVAMMDPGVGLGIAEWLRAMAHRERANEQAATQIWGARPDHPDRLAWLASMAYGPALAVARKVLGMDTK